MWKTNQNVTLGLFDFIAPASYITHVLLHYQAYIMDYVYKEVNKWEGVRGGRAGEQAESSYAFQQDCLE